MNTLLFSIGEMVRHSIVYYVCGTMSMCFTFWAIHWLTRGEEEIVGLKDDYRSWKAQDRKWYKINNQLLDIPMGIVWLFVSILFFVSWEGFFNLCYYFMNFDEIGALSFIIDWMPDNTFFNIIRLVLKIIDLFFLIIFQTLLLSLSTLTLTINRRGFIIPTLYRLVFFIIIAILYFDEIGEEFCFAFDPGDKIEYIIDFCKFGENLRTNAGYTFPIACLLDFTCYFRHQIK